MSQGPRGTQSERFKSTERRMEEEEKIPSKPILKKVNIKPQEDSEAFVADDFFD